MITISIPSKAAIFEHWSEWLDNNFFEWGEPSCWACRWGFNGKYDLKNGKASWKEIKNNWNRVPLQKCHIVPKAIGGLDSPDNLFLLCKECHDISPDSASKPAFLIWVSKQNYSQRLDDTIRIELKNFGFDRDDYERLREVVNSKDFSKWLDKNTGSHFNQRGLGNKYKVSTLIAGLWSFLNET